MRLEIGILTALLVLPSGHVPIASAASQEAPARSKEPDAPKISLQIKISADGVPALPSGSAIELSGADETCRQMPEEHKVIEVGGVTTVTVPSCMIRVVILITGFDTQTVTLDLAKHTQQSKSTVTITVKHQGPPVVAW
jgi:hypothetical protein